MALFGSVAVAVMVVIVVSDRAGTGFVVAVRHCMSAIQLSRCVVVVVLWQAFAAVLVTETVAVAVSWIAVSWMWEL